VPLVLLGPPFFPIILFGSTTLDDQHLLAHAMDSDFSVTWQWFSKRATVFLITDQTPRPYPTRSLPAQFWNQFYDTPFW
jgi:hypothetical protein